MATETFTSTLDRPAFIRSAVRVSIEAGEGLYGKAYLSDVARRIGATVPDLVETIQHLQVSDIELIRGDCNSQSADTDKLKASCSESFGEAVFFIDVIIL